MTQREYERLKAQEIVSYDNALTKLKARHQRRLAALETVLKMSRRDRVQRTATPADGISGSKGTVVMAVKNVVANLDDDFFTVKTIINHLPPGSKINSVSSALRRLHEGGMIHEIRAGGGRRAAVYRKVRAPQEGDENATG
jgi:hypothetical protein